MSANVAARILLPALTTVMFACGGQVIGASHEAVRLNADPIASAVPDPRVGPHALEEARHVSTAPLLAAATTSVTRMEVGTGRMAATRPLAVTPPPSPFHREVFGFAPYWALSSYAEWDYRLLSTVAYFGVTIEANGNFNTTVSGWNQWNSQDMVNMTNMAHQNGDRVVVVVKQFNSATINGLVTNSAATQVAIDHIIAAIDGKGLDGVNIDFEGSSDGYPNMQSGLVNFMSQLSQQVHARWATAEVSIDTYSGAASWDLGLFRIEQLAPVVDAMFIMAYDMAFEDNPGHASANAPMKGYLYNDTLSVEQYLAKAPASKVILGVPYYGYKWSTTGSGPNAAVRGGGTADTYGNIVGELACGGSKWYRHWDSLAESPWVAWYSPAANDPCEGNHGSWRELYYDNAYSLGLKYDLVNQNNLRGAGMWALGYDSGTRDLWNAIAAKLTTVTVWDTQAGILTADPAVTSWNTNRVDAFARGTDKQLWRRTWNGTDWSPWEPLGGILSSSPGAVSWGPDHIDVFARGTDNALWTKTWNGTAWSEWTSLGGRLTSGPDVTSWGPNRLDVFARGTDNALWHRWFDGTGWKGWERLGGRLTSDPAVATSGPNRLDVFGTGTDKATWHLWWDGAHWRGWESLGGILTSSPAAASCGSGTIDVFSRGLLGALYRKGWNGTAWSGWQPQGGMWANGPAAVCEPATTIIDVFEVARDRTLWRTLVIASG